MSGEFPEPEQEVIKAEADLAQDNQELNEEIEPANKDELIKDNDVIDHEQREQKETDEIEIDRKNKSLLKKEIDSFPEDGKYENYKNDIIEFFDKRMQINNARENLDPKVIVERLNSAENFLSNHFRVDNLSTIEKYILLKNTKDVLEQVARKSLIKKFNKELEEQINALQETESNPNRIKFFKYQMNYFEIPKFSFHNLNLEIAERWVGESCGINLSNGLPKGLYNYRNPYTDQSIRTHDGKMIKEFRYNFSSEIGTSSEDQQQRYNERIVRSSIAEKKLRSKGLNVRVDDGAVDPRVSLIINNARS